MVILAFPAERQARMQPGQQRGALLVTGAFRSPGLAYGSMRGWLRLIRMPSSRGSTHALGVISGTLYDGDGHRLGISSRRCLVPVTLDQATPAGSGHVVSVQGLTVDLLGFEVQIEDFIIGNAPVESVTVEEPAQRVRHLSASQQEVTPGP